MDGHRPARGGIILVLASGILTLLLLVSFMTAVLSRVSSMEASARSDGAGAALAAASGMEYAASRLARGGGPWSAAWDRRLRGEGARFAARAEPLDGRIPLNAGHLRGEDLAREFGPGGNGIPDCRETTLCYHRALAHVLNNLGWIRGIGTRRWSIPAGDPAAPGEPVEISWLGMDLIENRPPGGYRDWEQVEETLLGLGAGYTADDVARVRPFIDLSTEGTIAAGRTTGLEALGGNDVPPYIPVNLTTARPEVLESLFRYVGLRTSWDLFSAGANLVPYTRSGPAGSPRTTRYHEAPATLWPDEAGALAACLVDLRAAGPLSWNRIYREFSGRASVLFAREWAELSAHPLLKRFRVQAKADCAFMAICLDPCSHDGISHGGSTAWASWGIDRFPDDPAFPASLGFQPLPVVGVNRSFERIDYPPGDPDDRLVPVFPPWPQWGWGNAFNPYLDQLTYSGEICPQGGTLGPPLRFEAASLGRRGDATARLEGDFSVGERFDFTSQEDFDNLLEGRFLRDRGISVLDPDPPARYEWRTGNAPHDRLPDGSLPVYGDPAPGSLGPGRAPGDLRIQARATTLPGFNRRSMDFRTAPAPGVSHRYGAVTLARHETGPRGAAFYWPFGRDFDRTPDPALSGDARHEADPAFPGPRPARPMALAINWTNLEPGYTSNDIVATGPGAPRLYFECPGLVDGTGVTSFSLEAWIGKQGSLYLEGHTPVTFIPGFIRLHASWGVSGNRTGRDVRLDVAWTEDGIAPIPPFSSARWFVPDAPAGGRPVSFDTHLVLAVERVDPVLYRFHVFLDGSDAAFGGPMRLDHPHPMLGTVEETLQFVQISHLRIFDRALDEGEVAGLRVLGRFCRKGTFASPVYRFDRPARLSLAQWTGILPEGYPESALRVEVVARDDAGAERTVVLGASGLEEDLAGLGAVREFFYRVHFDCETGRGGAPVDDTPVFESIWFSFTRPGRSPGWRRWDGE